MYAPKVAASNRWKTYWKNRKRFSSKSLIYWFKRWTKCRKYCARFFQIFLYLWEIFRNYWSCSYYFSTGETPNFVKGSNNSPSWLYQNFIYGDTRGVVSVNFLGVLNICFGGNRVWSNNVMRKFFHNLSMQALSISGDSVVLKFDTMKNLNKNINDLRKTNIHMPKKRSCN